MHARAVRLLTVALLSASIAGCTASVPEDDFSPDESEVVEQPAEVEAEPEPEPVPETIAAVHTVPVTVTSRAGFVANVVVEWLPVITTTAASIPSNCIDVLTSLNTSDLSISTITQLPVRVTVDYPEVNGFTWPDSDIITMRFDGDGYGPPATCAQSLSKFDEFTLPLAASGGQVEASVIFVAEKTPNNPDGVPVDDLTTVTLGITNSSLPGYTCQVAGQATSCSFGNH